MADRPVRLVQPRLHKQLMTALIEGIVTGGYPSGELLPRELDLVERYGVSRGVVREAIRGLEERDLVVVRHGHGAIVRPESDWDVLGADILPVMLAGPRGVGLLGEVIEARRIVEVEAAGLAAERAGASHLQRIAAASRTMERLASAAVSVGRDDFLEADLAFHEAVIAAAANRALERVVAPIHHALLEARRPLARPEHRLTRALPEHLAILDAIRARDPERARAAMLVVFDTVTDYLSELATETETVDAQGGIA